eukprot:7382419-Prymnesium_polylepis.1
MSAKSLGQEAERTQRCTPAPWKAGATRVPILVCRRLRTKKGRKAAKRALRPIVIFTTASLTFVVIMQELEAPAERAAKAEAQRLWDVRFEGQAAILDGMSTALSGNLAAQANLTVLRLKLEDALGPRPVRVVCSACARCVCQSHFAMRVNSFRTWPS